MNTTMKYQNGDYRYIITGYLLPMNLVNAPSGSRKGSEWILCSQRISTMLPTDLSLAPNGSHKNLISLRGNPWMNFVPQIT